jgi:hypothetical protein
MAKLGFWVLVLSELFSVLASLRMLASPLALPEPWLRSGGSEVLIRAWAVTWLGLSAVLLTVLFTSFRRAERWAQLVMVTVPVVWLAHFILAPEIVCNVILALITSCSVAVNVRPRPNSTRSSR